MPWTTKNGIFLDLAENKESCIQLKNDNKLYFQRIYQSNTRQYHTYTQRMIPDIVIEGESTILIFDPKYRVADNLGTALGEMHKYRDGIIHSKTGERAVQNVYIVTPTDSKAAQEMKYFDKAYHEKYGIGALQLIPGNGLNELKEKLEECMREFL